MKRILVVDDEIMIRKVARVLLLELGYNVEVAEDPNEALLRLVINGERFDAVLTDLHCPDQNGGISLLKDINLFVPSRKTPVVLISGSIGDASASFLKYGFAMVIPKPFGIEKLKGLSKLFSTTELIEQGV
jgi:CheY-like chemotaxis protein